MAIGRLSWEPEWETPLDRAYLRNLVQELHDVLVARGFERSRVYGPRAATPDDPHDLLDGIAAWERFTESAADHGTMNGASVYGNGLVRIMLDERHALHIFTDEATPPSSVALTVTTFVDVTDRLLDSRLLD